jgi:hypothetical protein
MVPLAERVAAHGGAAVEEGVLGVMEAQRERQARRRRRDKSFKQKQSNKKM